MSIESRIAKLEAQARTDAPADDSALVIFDDGAGYIVSVPQRAMERCAPMIEKIYGNNPPDGGLTNELRFTA